jgi:CBS domain-containing protein
VLSLPQGGAQHLEARMKISDCMTRDVQLANPEMTLRDAAKLMAKCDSGVLPVGENDRLVGILTDRDIAIRGIAEGKGPDAKVRQAMSSDVRWCYEDENIDGVLRRLGDEQIRRMPVLSRSKRLVGIVALADLTINAQPQQTGATLSAISRHGGQHSQALH